MNRKEYHKEHYLANKPRYYWNQVRRLYRVEKDFIYAIGNSQHWMCPICTDPMSPAIGRFTVDHCHVTGKVRGILHRKCNTGLGLLRDSPDIMRNAIKYLNKRRYS